MKKSIIISLTIIGLLLGGCKKDKEETVSPGSIYGAVTDFTTGEPVRSANVQLRPIGETTLTGYDGMYEFKDIDDGDYSITVSKAEYTDLIDPYIIAVRDGRRMKRDVQILKKSTVLNIVNNYQYPITELDFGSNDGILQKSFNLVNSGNVSLNFTITKTANWISDINPQTGIVNKGETKLISVIINRELLSEGDNVTTIVVATNAGGVELTIKARKEGDGINDLVVEIPNTNIMVQTTDLGCFDWYSAEATCLSSNVANYNDWRLPTLDELKILFNYRQYIGGFTNDKYWSSSEDYYQNLILEPYCVDFRSGRWFLDIPNHTYNVRAVRTTTGGGGDGITWSDNFDNGSLNYWTRIDADGDGLKWQITDFQSTNFGNAHSGHYCASSISWNNNVAYNPDNYMISPLCQNATNIQYYVATNTGYPDHYAVMASSTGTNPNDFTIVFEETAPVSKCKDDGVKTQMRKNDKSRDMSPWTERNINLPSGTKYVAYRHFNSYNMNYIFIDDVTITMER